MQILNPDEFTPSDWERLVVLDQIQHAPDPQWIADELKLCAIQRVNDPTCGFLYWVSRYWWIVDKDLRESLLRPNWLQRDYLARRAPQNIILKYRKGGASTIVDALYFWRCLFVPHTRAVIAAHVLESTDDLFGRLHYGHGRLPMWMKPRLKYSSKKELVFEHNMARLRVLTAGGQALGRAGDADLIHLSEFAFYRQPWKVLSGLVESGRRGMELDIESTPNGWNEFKALYDEAKNGSRRAVFFYPWWRDPLNRLSVVEPLGELTQDERVLGLDPEQVAWRRGKIHDLRDLFRQEHPEDDESCFLSSGALKFPGELLRELRQVVSRAVRPLPLHGVGPFGGDDNGHLEVWVEPEPGARYIIGADVAEGTPKGNFSAAGVLLTRGPHDLPEQVAAWVGRIPPAYFAHTLAKLGRWYNDAEIAVERNNHGHSTIRALYAEADYPRSLIYRHVKYDQRAKSVQQAKFGWPTDAVTRPQMLDDLSAAILRGDVVWRHDRFLAECMAFEAGDEFKTESAISSSTRDSVARNNDTVFAWGIALQVLRRSRRYRDEQRDVKASGT